MTNRTTTTVLVLQEAPKKRSPHIREIKTNSCVFNKHLQTHVSPQPRYTYSVNRSNRCSIVFFFFFFLSAFLCVSRIVNNFTLSAYCKHLFGPHLGVRTSYIYVIRVSFRRDEKTPAAYIISLGITTVTLAIGFLRQHYVGYAKVRQDVKARVSSSGG